MLISFCLYYAAIFLIFQNFQKIGELIINLVCENLERLVCKISTKFGDKRSTNNFMELLFLSVRHLTNSNRSFTKHVFIEKELDAEENNR